MDVFFGMRKAATIADSSQCHRDIRRSTPHR
jgi:hypothetical protein